MKAPDIAHMLAGRIDRLVGDLLPAGHREGHEWRCGSVAGEPGNSLGVHLTGTKAGVWSDFSTGQKGDALDLVREVLGLNMRKARQWSLHWLGRENGELPKPETPDLRKTAKPTTNPDRWRKVWERSRPIATT